MTSKLSRPEGARHFHAWVILRETSYDHRDVASRPVDQVISITRILGSEADAIEETARLNELNGPKGERYFYLLGRIPASILP